MIIEEFRAEMKEDKVMKSMFTFLERMFACAVFKPVLDNPNNTFAVDIYNLLRDEVTKTKDSEKLTASVEIFCQLLQVRIINFVLLNG
jgi:ribulose 1,5-bisphosphate carboxylase large subunit-like protein